MAGTFVYVSGVIMAAVMFVTAAATIPCAHGLDWSRIGVYTLAWPMGVVALAYDDAVGDIMFLDPMPKPLHCEGGE